MNSDNSSHSKIGASSYYRWRACPGSVRLSEGIPSRTSSYAEEGTQAHEVGAHVLTSGAWPMGIGEEMRAAISVYIDTVQEDIRSVIGKTTAEVLVEHRFDLSSIHRGMYGTADCVVYYPDTYHLAVYDYKHGAGIPVEVHDNGEPNEQLTFYGLGAIRSIERPVHTVEIVIVQPRCPHPDGEVRRFKFSAIELLDFASDLKEAALRTEDPNAPLVSGSHCKFCPAAGVCPEVHKNALAIAKEEFSPALSYDVDKLAHTLNWLPVLEDWIKNVREFAYGEALHGRTPPGWKLVAKRATRKWRDPDKVGEVIHERTKLPNRLIYETDVKSPTQIEKLLDKSKKSLLEDLIVAESSGYTLAPETDKRESIKLTAKNEFTDIVN